MKLSKEVKNKLVKGEFNVICGEQVFNTKGKLLADKKEAQWSQTHGRAITLVFENNKWVQV